MSPLKCSVFLLHQLLDVDLRNAEECEPTLCGLCVLAPMGGCMCPCGCCSINAELCPENMKANQRLPGNMLLIEGTGLCACEEHLSANVSFLFLTFKLKTSPHFLVSLWGAVVCVCVSVSV